MDRNYGVITFISEYLYLKKSRVATFVDIIKIVNMFIKTIFKDSKKVKRIRNHVSKCNLYVFLDIAKFVDFR